MQIGTIGIDLAKTVFQVHGEDAADKPMLEKQPRRGQAPFTPDRRAIDTTLVGGAVRVEVRSAALRTMRMQI
jgi:hypothetical protein